ncbi:MAG: AlwI family type II restriction endonuclease, partial [Verrucomicrobia bacterium]|nr:AlwI family type II restriction endonuclease [Verrucomicrobiota bacterium]
LVVEVTLTDSSRQEAVEGEPVRRHVASMSIQSTKPVLCLFIANHIDSNTAETFRNGIWFTKDDTKLLLNIIPLELKQFKSIFRALFASGVVDYHIILNLLQKCRDRSKEEEAPGWKRIIEKEVSVLIHNLSNTQPENKGYTLI